MSVSRKINRLFQTACAVMSVALTSGAACAGTVISEVLYDVSGSDNGAVFIELYGVPGTVLDDLFIEGINGSNGDIYKSVALFGTIPPDGVFVIGDDAGDGSTLVAGADLIAEVDLQNGPDSVVLRSAEAVLDALGYGDFSGKIFAGEGNAAPAVEAGSSLARGNPGIDTDNNLADFGILDLPTPGDVPVNTVPVPAAGWLLVSGLVGLAGISRRRVPASRARGFAQARPFPGR